MMPVGSAGASTPPTPVLAALSASSMIGLASRLLRREAISQAKPTATMPMATITIHTTRAVAFASANDFVTTKAPTTFSSASVIGVAAASSPPELVAEAPPRADWAIASVRGSGCPNTTDPLRS